MPSQIIPDMIQTKIQSHQRYLDVHLGENYELPNIKTEVGQKILYQFPSNISNSISSIYKLELIKDFENYLTLEFIFNLLKNDAYQNISICHLFDMLIYHSTLFDGSTTWQTKQVSMPSYSIRKKKVI